VKKKKNLSLSALKKKAWKLVSEYVRRKDADEGGFVSCYTCGFPMHWKYEAQAGHAIPGRHNAVLLDIEILRPQCYACNCARKGMHHIFTTKLIEEHGMDWWKKKLDGARQIVKYTRDDLEKLIELFKARLT